MPDSARAGEASAKRSGRSPSGDGDSVGDLHRRSAGQRGLGMDGKQDRRERRLVEVEVSGQVAEDRDVLAHGRSWIGSTVRLGVQALSVEGVVLDELVIRVEA